MKRAILYARVSTDDQADKGYSLPSQIEAMRHYATQQGFEVVQEFREDYSGATPIEMRPEGRKAYAMLRGGDADVIIAYTIDRFVRPPEDGDEWDMPILIRGLAKLGKEIHTVKRGKLNTNFADLLIALLDARKAGEERRDITERTVRGKRAKAKAGKIVGGRAPYGYRHVRNHLGAILVYEIVEEEARVVRMIYRWCVKGDEHGNILSSGAIARRLTEMRVPTPSEVRPGFHSKWKGIWNRGHVAAIIRNEIYAGVWWYGARTNKGRTIRPREEQIAVDVPAVVQREIWERAQVQLQNNIVFSLRNCRNEYLLRGLIRCACGYSMVGERCHDTIYYRCNARKISAMQSDLHICSARHVRAAAIEADIWDEIKELFEDLPKLRHELIAAQQNEDDKLLPLRDKIKITDDLLAQAKAQTKRIAEAIPELEKGSEGRKAMIEKDKALTAQIAQLERQREKYAQELEAGSAMHEKIESVMRFAENVKAGIPEAEKNFNAKRRIIETLVISVTVTDRRYHLQTILGEKDGEVSKLKYGGVRIVTQSSRLLRHNWHISLESIEDLVRAVLAELPDSPDEITPTAQRVAA